MIESRLDHIVVAARTLEAGADYVESALGVRVPDGGQHEFMGTHNKVMSLGDSVYLEIIAVDPELPAPKRPRWFGLDDPLLIGALEQGPRLLTWAVNTSNLSALIEASSLAVGNPFKARRQDLRWQVALTDDGRASAGGFFPLCIEWLTDFHPAQCMADLGCRLRKLELHHPRAAWLEDSLKSINADHLVSIIPTQSDETPGFIRALIETPDGDALLENNLH